MNFSKKGTIEKQQKIQSASTKLAKKTNVIIYRIFLVSIILFVMVGASSLYGVVSGLIDNAPSIENIDVAPTGYATYVYNSDGKMVQSLVGSNANREFVSIDKIPEVVQQAFIAIEDERFYEHNGIDVRGIFRSFFTGLASGSFSQGASTLTQQLLKNQVFNGGNEANFIVKLERKIQEQYLAIQLEDTMSKEKILENYLNTINLGANTLGVQVASKRYFNKDVSKLNLSEAAVIAGITQSPTNLNPITNPEANAKRRTEVLGNMLRLGFITQEDYDAALADDVYSRIQAVNDEYTTTTNINSYFVDELIEQVQEDLVGLGYTESQASKMIYTGGLRIYTTQDSELQNICDTILSDESNYPKDTVYELEYRLSVVHADGTQTHYSEGNLKNYFYNMDKDKGIVESKRFDLYFDNKDDATKYIEEFKASKVGEGDTAVESINFKLQPQISFTLMDQHTGEVKAIVGGRGEKTGNRTLNRATNTTRSPGSTFKILSTFLPALDTAGMTLATVYDDAEYYYPNDPTRKVNNWSKDYKGFSTIRQAIKGSMNIVSVKTLADVTPQVGYDYLKNLGFTTLDPSDANNYSTALGGLTNGVTNLELTAGYAAIANGGYYNKPIFYTKITDRNGNVILENKTESKQVMKETTAWLLTDAMKDVVSTGGTGAIVRFSNIKMPLAGKTGTSTDDKDLWFAGFTPYYTATIWGGYDYGVNQNDTTYHKKLWKKIMEEIHKNLDYTDFTKPASIKSAKICTKSGKLAVEGVCDHAEGGSTVRTEYFASGTVPTEKCDVHIKLTICKDSGLRATEFCPNTEEKVYLLKEETSQTKDTPYIMPAGLDQHYCTEHTSLATPEPTPTPEPITDPATTPTPTVAPPVSEEQPEDSVPSTDETPVEGGGNGGVPQ